MRENKLSSRRPWTSADVSALVVFRADQPQRAQNLRVATAAMRAAGVGEILVYEDPPAGVAPPFARVTAGPGTGPLHKTRAFNRLAAGAGGKVLALADADCLIPADRWAGAVAALWAGADAVWPYDGRFVDVASASAAAAGETLMTDSVGGLVLVRAASFWRAGGEHEGFVGWGYEDDERWWRYHALNFRVERLPGEIYHLRHDPSPHSRTWGTAQTDANARTFERAKRLPPGWWRPRRPDLL